MYTLLRQCGLRWLGHVRRMNDGRILKDILYGELDWLPLGRGLLADISFDWEPPQTSGFVVDNYLLSITKSCRQLFRAICSIHTRTNFVNTYIRAAFKITCFYFPSFFKFSFQKESYFEVENSCRQLLVVDNCLTHVRIQLVAHKRLLSTTNEFPSEKRETR